MRLGLFLWFSRLTIYICIFGCGISRSTRLQYFQIHQRYVTFLIMLFMYFSCQGRSFTIKWKNWLPNQPAWTYKSLQTKSFPKFWIFQIKFCNFNRACTLEWISTTSWVRQDIKNYFVPLKILKDFLSKAEKVQKRHKLCLIMLINPS